MNELSFEVRTALIDMHRIIEDHSRALVEALLGALAHICYPPSDGARPPIQLAPPISARKQAVEAVVRDRLAAAFHEWLNVLDATHDPEVLDGDPWLGLRLCPADAEGSPFLHDAFFDSWHDYIRTRPID